MGIKMNKTLKVSYCAVFQFDSDGINIVFPDLKGCLSCAYSEKRLIQTAEEALSLWLSGMRYSELPTPTPVSAIICRPNENAHTITVQVHIKGGIIK